MQTSPSAYEQAAKPFKTVRPLGPKATTSTATKLPAVGTTANSSADEALFDLQQEVAIRKTAFTAAQLQAQTCARLVAGMEKDLRSLLDDEQRLLVAQPPAQQRLCQVQEWLAERQDALEQQRQLLEMKQLVSTSGTQEGEDLQVSITAIGQVDQARPCTQPTHPQTPPRPS